MQALNAQYLEKRQEERIARERQAKVVVEARLAKQDKIRQLVAVHATRYINVLADAV